jgi:hypothetical protein
VQTVAVSNKARPGLYAEVKPLCADDSVAGCHVKVGHLQAFNPKSPVSLEIGLFFLAFLGNVKKSKLTIIISLKGLSNSQLYQKNVLVDIT